MSGTGHSMTQHAVTWTLSRSGLRLAGPDEKAPMPLFEMILAVGVAAGAFSAGAIFFWARHTLAHWL